MKHILLRCLACLLITGCIAMQAIAQVPDVIYSPQIKNVKLHIYGNQLAYPIIKLNGTDRLELHFDDLDATVKSYSYTYQLCNADWTPAILSQFDFIKGFSQQRITNYKISSIALTRYIHYQAVLPENNMAPSRSGNYLVKVFLNGDTSRLAFTRRLLVVSEQAAISAQIQQPFNGQYFYTHQKVFFTVNTRNTPVVNAMQQVKVCILQNNRWDNAISGIRPTFIRQNQLEYNTEQDCLFPGGKEWRWLDLRSFRFQSDRIKDVQITNNSTTVEVREDADRSQQRFVFYRDNDGMFYNSVTESINPYWQADFATVHFSFKPPGGLAFPNRDVYLFGELSNYGLLPEAKMQFNASNGMYETDLLLKQGYYDYSYITIDRDDARRTPSFQFTEGNYWDTENNYTILLYFRPLGDRADQLIGITRINSLAGRPGSNF